MKDTRVSLYINNREDKDESKIKHLFSEANDSLKFKINLSMKFRRNVVKETFSENLSSLKCPVGQN